MFLILVGEAAMENMEIIPAEKGKIFCRYTERC